jgi:hypothetical protein
MLRELLCHLDGSRKAKIYTHELYVASVLLLVLHGTGNWLRGSCGDCHSFVLWIRDDKSSEPSRP